ncbi:MAG: stage II sporulation protein R [Acutalibacteraceae bacterium]
MIGVKTKAIISGFIISVLISFTGFFNRCECISDKIFRLHIIANSDQDFDQDLKLKVRDRILKDFGSKFKNLSDLVSAEKLTEENIENIKRSAIDEIKANGYDYPVEIYITRMYFNTRTYDDISMPAGVYDALRVVIGEGKGKNWWCVMFPPMCVSAACEKDELGTVLNKEEIEILENKREYNFEFKILEIFFQIKNFIDESIQSLSVDIFKKYDVDFYIIDVLKNIKNSFLEDL